MVYVYDKLLDMHQSGIISSVFPIHCRAVRVR